MKTVTCERTAEAVSPKHPDKMCDQISDALLDWCLTKDPTSRVAIETMGGHGYVYITGEVTIPNGDEKVLADLASYAWEVVKRITGKEQQVSVNIVRQSHEIANGVDTGGAGDQGIMVGYACEGNPDMIPNELFLARSLCQFIYAKYPYDGKTQVTLDDLGKIKTIVASFQNVSKKDLEDVVKDWSSDLTTPIENILCNPAGDWNVGGFDADTGLTGRKLMVDNYGPQIPIGGGAFSGKDSTKVDRSAAYIARKIAVNYLKVFHKKEVMVKIAYAIGVAKPVMVTIFADGEKCSGAGKDIPKYDLTPKGIIEFLNLREPQFEKTAQWGHFGNNFPWDK